MPTESIRCQFIDPKSKIECDNWYPYEEGQKYCLLHRTAQTEEVHIIIPRTVTVANGDHIQQLNAKIAECLQMSIPEIVEHIRGIEEQIRVLERDRRAANIAKRNLEDRLTEEERASLREQSQSYGRGAAPERSTKKAKSPEDRAKSRKEGFSAWAARLGMKVEDLMVMDDDEMTAKIAKYKASKG